MNVRVWYLPNNIWKNFQMIFFSLCAIILSNSLEKCCQSFHENMFEWCDGKVERYALADKVLSQVEFFSWCYDGCLNYHTIQLLWAHTRTHMSPNDQLRRTYIDFDIAIHLRHIFILQNSFFRFNMKCLLFCYALALCGICVVFNIICDMHNCTQTNNFLRLCLLEQYHQYDI